MAYGNAAMADGRRENRDEVHFRARAVHADGRSLQLLVVNISPGGFMARCDSDIADGSRLRIALPGRGMQMAQVRWALGGRIGCQLERSIPLAEYHQLLATLTR